MKTLSPSFTLTLILRDLGKIDDLMADITEQQDVAQEISDAISRPSGETFDEVETVSVFIKTFFFCTDIKICLVFCCVARAHLSFFVRMNCWLSWRS